MSLTAFCDVLRSYDAQAWLEQPGVEQLLQRQCAEAWQQALGHSRKRKQQQGQQHPQQQEEEQMQQQEQPGHQQQGRTAGGGECEGRGKDGRQGKGKAGAKGGQGRRTENGTELHTKPLSRVDAGFSFNFAL